MSRGSSTSEWITRNEQIGADGLAGLWDSIVAAEEVKERLLNHALLALKLRPVLPYAATGLHGLLLLHGPPGTGKTTLSRALAPQLAAFVPGGIVRLIEINPHGLMSAEHGQSQQRVTDLLCEQVPLLADDRKPTVLVLDEVESMAVARSAASLSANPADVHRATDAVLTALDTNAAAHPHILTLATSNFTQALDEAFRSRADAAIEMPLPSQEAIAAIIAATLREFATAYPALAALADARALQPVATAMRGSDGRRARKLVSEALAQRRATVLDPSQLSVKDLAAAARLNHKDPSGR
jgi:SpoVK/Ycf46/Vps4 family AAA+-type ATPase